MLGIKPEDSKRMDDLAKELRITKNPDARLDMQLRFVKDMTPYYGHERATRMLSMVWKKAKSRTAAL